MSRKYEWSNIKSVLFVPANEHRLNHIFDISADAFIIDLEDSIKEESKGSAREELKDWLSNIKEKTIGSVLILRINKGCIEYEADLFASEPLIDCIAVPKVEQCADIEEVINCFPNKDILALIETPKGMIQLDSVLVDNMINAVGFGGEDFCVAMGMKKSQEYLMSIKQRLLMHCKAYGKIAFDMVEAEYKDREKYSKLARHSKELGFDGKLAIHPNQIEVINQVYNNVNEGQMRHIVLEYEKVNEGFVMIDGVIYEKPHIDRMRKLLGEG